jgi:Na+/H+ antiporter NhaC
VIHRGTMIWTVSMAVITLAALFFFHGNSGSYSATHGATAVVSQRAGSPLTLGILTLPFVSILLVALVRCWLFVRIARERAEARPMAPSLDPSVRM